MIFFAYSRDGYTENFYRGNTLDDVVSEIQSDGNDPEDYMFFEVDETTNFQVEMKAVRKQVPVRVTKAK